MEAPCIKTRFMQSVNLDYMKVLISISQAIKNQFLLLFILSLLWFGNSYGQIKTDNLSRDNAGIVITEIMYNPPETNTDSLEFIELYNNSDAPINLLGYYFSEGVEYTFPDITLNDGEYLVIAADSLAVMGTFNVDARQWFSSGLNNSGERIELRNALDELIDQVDYDDSAPWPVRADGDGPSLELCNPDEDNYLGYNWSAATYFQLINADGDSIWCTPGMHCNPWFEPPITEFSANQTDILSGWEVDFTDETQGNPETWSWTFEGGSPASSSEQNPAGIVFNNPGNFEICLTTSNAYGDDSECKTAYIHVSAPPNAEIVITEIMYNSPDANTDSLEFIELFNTGPDAIDLNGWTISDAVSYTFNQEEILTAGNRLLIAKDPQAMLHVFGVTSFQWSGTLSNSSAVVLLKDNYGFVKDSVKYSDEAPWPTSCDGRGPSLTLCEPELDNSLAASWSASTEFAALLTDGDTVYATPGFGCLYIPNADFTANATSITAGESVQFTDLSTNNPDIWHWTFEGGNPNTSNTQNPLVLYENEGIFSVKLIVENEDGSDSLLRENYIHVSAAPSGATLVITEIMYNSPDANTDSLDFIEVLNNGEDAVNVRNFNFVEGITFTFPDIDLQAQSRMVIAKNAAAVSQFFGIQAFEWETGSLSNDGELILLQDAAGITLDSVVYSAFTPWPEVCNGDGPSLTLCDPNLNNAIPENWSASEEYAGTLLDGDSVFATPGTGCIYYPHAAFTADPLQIFKGESVQFTDQSTNEPSSWLWSFPGGNPATSNEQNPTITYPETGIYDVKLEVTNSYGVDSLRKTAYIIVAHNPEETQLVITEIMYNSPDSDIDSLDFIELKNNGSETINLNGFYFESGINFTFPDYDLQAQSYVVVAKNAEAIYSFFGTDALNWESGSLSNEGELLTISDNFGIILDSVRYADSLPWPPQCDGDGPSLTLCDASLDNSLPSSWSASVEFKGQLANEDSVFATPGTGCLYLPRANFSADTTQIYTGSDIQFYDLSTNSPSNWEWEFPGGTPSSSSEQNPIISYNNSGIYPVSLRVSNEYSSDSLTKEEYIYVFNDPETTKLVITEIMYNSPDPGDSIEFVEVFNNGSNNLNLEDFSFSGLSFTFPEYFLEPGAYAVIAKNASAVQSFYGVDCFEWDAGSSLNNTGEDLIIRDNMDVIVDSVFYMDSLPWPVLCDGDGPSLTLCEPDLDNSLASSWQTSIAFAGIYDGDSVFATPGRGCAFYPRARFEADITTPEIGQEVQFFNLSENDPDEIQWQFSGTFPETSTEENPIVTYSEAGTFDVKLMVSNEFGTDSLTKKNYIKVNMPPSNAELIITEIMYNSPDELDDTLEFIELYNKGSEKVQMSNILIASGFDYEFPEMFLLPGRYLVIAKSSSAMMNTFGVEALQWTNGSLNNSGELLLLTDKAGITIDSVRYADTLPWPPQCDGDGPSLSLCKHDLDNSLAESWNISLNLAAVLTNGDLVFATPGTGCLGVPEAFFDADTNTVYEGQSVQFTDLSIGIPNNWEWTFEGGTPESSSEQNPLVRYFSEGIFNVSLSVSNQYGTSTETKAAYINVLKNNSIANINPNYFSIKPNPATNQLSIETVATGSWLEICDLTGRMLLKEQIEGTKKVINIQNFKAGMYLVIVRNTGNSLPFTQKLIVE